MENLEITKRFYDELTAIQVLRLRKIALADKNWNALETTSVFVGAFSFARED